MDKENRKTLFKGGLFAVFSFISKGIGFLLLLLLAKMMTPDEYGHLSIFNTFVTFGSFIVAFSAQGYASVSFFKESHSVFKKDFSAIIFLSILSTILLALFILLFGSLLESKLGVPISFQYYAVIISLFVFVFNIHQDLYRVKEKIVSYGIFNCSFALLNCALSIYLVIQMGHSWHGRVCGYLICSIVFFIISLFLIVKDGLISFHFGKENVKKAFFWGFPLIPHAATTWIRQGIDQYIINDAYSASEVGIFSFALNLVNIITVIGWAFNATNSVTIYKVLSGDTKDKETLLRKQIKLLFFVYLISTIAVVICVLGVVSLFFDKYTSSVQYFLILSVYGFLQCVYYIYCNYLFYYNQTKHLMFITFMCSLLHMILSFVLTGMSLYYTSFIYVLVQTIIVFLVFRKSRKLLLEEGIRI